MKNTMNSVRSFESKDKDLILLSLNDLYHKSCKNLEKNPGDMERKQLIIERDGSKRLIKMLNEI